LALGLSCFGLGIATGRVLLTDSISQPLLSNPLIMLKVTTEIEIRFRGSAKIRACEEDV
jgi:hypothetical protein